MTKPIVADVTVRFKLDLPSKDEVTERVLDIIAGLPNIKSIDAFVDGEIMSIPLKKDGGG
ncbi:MAG: hypothetical protein PHG35_02210 [Dehalococcoidales bacterium]|nr:hypothetical protein [Dehalococcoidales bacterium]